MLPPPPPITFVKHVQPKTIIQPHQPPNPPMATSNRLKTKKRTVQPNKSNSQQPQPFVSSPHPHKPQKKDKAHISDSHAQHRQQQYQNYLAHKQSNPNGVEFTVDVFPNNFELAQKLSIPVGFTFSPLIALENEHAAPMDKDIDTIPRCGVCMAYMNCYNSIDNGKNGQKFRCFLCHNITYVGQYREEVPPNQQRKSPIFQAQGSKKIQELNPLHIPQSRIVLLIDVGPETVQSPILQYLVAALKEVLSRPEFDESIVQLYTFTEVVQAYDFGGAEVRCVVLDRTIKSDENARIVLPVLKDCRDKLFWVLDQLEEFSRDCELRGSCFGNCLEYVVNATRGTGTQYFVVQVNEGLGGEQLFTEKLPKSDQPKTEHSVKKYFESFNKTLYKKYIQQTVNSSNTFFFFIFAKNYKNIRVLSDFVKVSSSVLKYYAKDSEADLNKFYYELSYLLGATYFKQLTTQFIISHGWQFNCVYANHFRVKQRIIFSITSCEPTRQYCVTISPNKNVQEQPSYCAIQIIINYQYLHNYYVTVLTIVQIVTGSLSTLYKTLDACSGVGLIAKAFLSTMRSEEAPHSRKVFIEVVSHFYKQVLGFFKNKEAIPDAVLTMLMGSLAILKSIHTQPQAIANEPIFDQIIAERNYLSFCSLREISSFFMPYLFDLSSMDSTMCRDDVEFVYPPTVQLRFQNVKEGLFLMDCGLVMYLFIASSCNTSLLKKVFGKSKFSQHQLLTEQHLSKQQTQQSRQIRTLVKYLRQQKSYEWIPLYIVRCRQATKIQKNFYMSFTLQKYAQFKMYKDSFEEYLQRLKQPNLF